MSKKHDLKKMQDAITQLNKQMAGMAEALNQWAEANAENRNTTGAAIMRLELNVFGLLKYLMDKKIIDLEDAQKAMLHLSQHDKIEEFWGSEIDYDAPLPTPEDLIQEAEEAVDASDEEKSE